MDARGVIQSFKGFAFLNDMESDENEDIQNDNHERFRKHICKTVLNIYQISHCFLPVCL